MLRVCYCDEQRTARHQAMAAATPQKTEEGGDLGDGSARCGVSFNLHSNPWLVIISLARVWWGGVGVLFYCSCCTMNATVARASRRGTQQWNCSPVRPLKSGLVNFVRT